MAQTHLPEKWIERVCSILEIPPRHETHRFFEAWQRAEGGHARWNPLNSSLRLSGTVDWTEATDYNNVPVRNYTYAIAGVVATALTIAQREPDGVEYVYGALLKNLRDGSLTAEEIVSKSFGDIKYWGTNPGTMLDVLKSIK